MESEKIIDEQRHSKQVISANGFSFVSLVLGLIMIIIGSRYWDDDLCRLSASSYLYYGGVFSTTVNILALTTALVKWWALKVLILI